MKTFCSCVSCEKFFRKGIKMELNTIYNEDCLEGMKRIPDKSVDMILCDLPYGTTACKWDTVIPFENLLPKIIDHPTLGKIMLMDITENDLKTMKYQKVIDLTKDVQRQELTKT